jgi:hypothetical protein
LIPKTTQEDNATNPVFGRHNPLPSTPIPKLSLGPQTVIKPPLLSVSLKAPQADLRFCIISLAVMSLWLISQLTTRVVMLPPGGPIFNALSILHQPI